MKHRRTFCKRGSLTGTHRGVFPKKERRSVHGPRYYQNGSVNLHAQKVHTMSGERTLLAHKIRLLADEPIVGPDDSHVLLSTNRTTGLGNNPSLTTAAVAVPLPVAPGTVFQLSIASATSTTLYNANDGAYALNPVITVGGGLLNVACKQLRGRVQFHGYLSTNNVIPPISESVSVIINVTDNLGFSANKILNVSIVSPDPPSVAGFSFVMPLLLPYAANRTAIQVGVRINNISTISIQCPSSEVVLEIDQ